MSITPLAFSQHTIDEGPLSLFEENLEGEDEWGKLMEEWLVIKDKGTGLLGVTVSEEEGLDCNKNKRKTLSTGRRIQY